MQIACFVLEPADANFEISRKRPQGELDEWVEDKLAEHADTEDGSRSARGVVECVCRLFGDGVVAFRIAGSSPAATCRAFTVCDHHCLACPALADTRFYASDKPGPIPNRSLSLFFICMGTLTAVQGQLGPT